MKETIIYIFYLVIMAMLFYRPADSYRKVFIYPDDDPVIYEYFLENIQR